MKTGPSYRSPPWAGPPLRALLLLLSAVFVLLPASVTASCATAANLAALHEAYGDMIEGHGTPRADIGRHVLAGELRRGGESELASRIARGGFFEEMDRISPILSAMASLSAGSYPEDGFEGHTENRAVLADILRSTGCFVDVTEELDTVPDDVPQPDTSDDLEAFAEGEIPLEPRELGPIRVLGDYVRENPTKATALCAALLTALGFVAFHIRRRMLRAKARAYPRYTLGRPFLVRDAKGNRHTLVVVDISRGGVMLTRTAAVKVDQFDRAIIDLCGALVAMSPVWENAHFLGMTFEEPISESLLREVLASGDTAENTAPPEPEVA